MSTIRHDAIVATSFDYENLTRARDKAKELGLPVSEIVRANINAYVSFLIAPDGSKEGWDASEAGNKAREEWKMWVQTTISTYVDWVHVRFGGDDKGASVEDANQQEFD